MPTAFVVRERVPSFRFEYLAPFSIELGRRFAVNVRGPSPRTLTGSRSANGSWSAGGGAPRPRPREFGLRVARLRLLYPPAFELKVVGRSTPRQSLPWPPVLGTRSLSGHALDHDVRDAGARAET